MAGQNKLTPEQRRKQLAEEMWLLYFNQTLFEQGIITESKRNQMLHLITSRCSYVEKQNSKIGIKQMTHFQNLHCFPQTNSHRNSPAGNDMFAERKSRFPSGKRLWLS